MSKIAVIDARKDLAEILNRAASTSTDIRTPVAAKKPLPNRRRAVRKGDRRRTLRQSLPPFTDSLLNAEDGPGNRPIFVAPESAAVCKLLYAREDSNL